MRIRQLLTASALYGIGDMLVLGVGGFLLLPLYTHALSQAEFGSYVAIKANTEILGYVLYFGLTSAAGRLYFDYRKDGHGREYFNSILMVFLLVVLAAIGVLALVGNAIWDQFSPTTPSQPYLWYALGIAAVTFIGQLGSLWLRLDNRVTAFVAVQVASAAALTAAAFAGLVLFDLGLPGLLIAMMVGYLPMIGAFFFRLGDRLRPNIRRQDLMPSLHYGLPFAVSYIGYFLLNRFSVLTLQHHVTIDQIAIFGLAQQLAVLISVVSASFGKAMQPAVFGADAASVDEILRRSSRLFILLIFCTASGAILFARELVELVAPASYLSALDVLFVLLLASFVYSLSLVSNTALEYHKRARTAAAISVGGAVVSVVLGLVLVPWLGLMGGAISTLGAYATVTLVGHIKAYQLTGQSYFGQMAALTAILCALAVVAGWPGWQALGLVGAVAAKGVLAAVVLSGTFALFAPQRVTQAIALIRASLSRS